MSTNGRSTLKSTRHSQSDVPGGGMTGRKVGGFPAAVEEVDESIEPDHWLAGLFERGPNGPAKHRRVQLLWPRALCLRRYGVETADQLRFTFLLQGYPWHLLHSRWETEWLRGADTHVSASGLPAGLVARSLHGLGG
jgi:hypothetical protein